MSDKKSTTTIIITPKHVVIIANKNEGIKPIVRAIYKEMKRRKELADIIMTASAMFLDDINIQTQKDKEDE